MTNLDQTRDGAASSLPPAGQEAVPLYGPRFSQRPGDLYRELRQRYGPVAPVVLEGGVPAWLVLGYREVYHVASNPQQFARDSRRWNAWSEIPDDWPLMPYVGYRPTVLFTEGEEHRRRAGAISDALAAVDQFELTAICERTCDELIDGFAGRGAADLITEYAHRIPVRVVVRLFGMPDADLPALIHDIAVSLDEGEEAVAAHQRTVARMRQLVAGKRQQPGPDVPSRMLAHAAGLSDEEVALDLLMVLASAQQPVANWIGNTLRLMLTDDRFAITLAGGRRSVSEALNEVLWEDTPTQNFIGRWAVRDTRLGGRHIRAGDLLVLGLAAANADPSVRPDSSPGTSGNHAHMSFGHGEHSCPHPAPELAEVIARSAIGVLLDRLPDAALAVGADELRWRPSVWMRGLFSLPVRFTPAG